MKDWYKFVSLPVVFVIILSLTALLDFGSTNYIIGYSIVELVGLAVAWNLLFGKLGYVNFGAVAFYGLGAYTTAFLILNFMDTFSLGLFIVFVIVGGLTSAIFGMVLSGLTMRLRGIYFAIAALALIFVVHTVVLSSEALGSATGLYSTRPDAPFLFGSFIEFLFVLISGLTIVVVGVSWYIDSSWIGNILTAVGDDEVAASAIGIPTLKIKSLVCGLHAFFLGLMGTPLLYHLTYLNPKGVFSIYTNVNMIASVLLGGAAAWFGPVIGGLVLGSSLQVSGLYLGATLSRLVPGVILLIVIMFASGGIVGSLRSLKERLTTEGK